VDRGGSRGQRGGSPTAINLSFLDRNIVLTERKLLCNVFYVRFEAFTAVTMKNVDLWDVTPCGSCKNRHLGGNLHLHHPQRASVASYG
jgi:hypothetical protein